MVGVVARVAGTKVSRGTHKSFVGGRRAVKSSIAIKAFGIAQRPSVRVVRASRARIVGGLCSVLWAVVTFRAREHVGGS
jgi:hypothetical protein